MSENPVAQSFVDYQAIVVALRSHFSHFKSQLTQRIKVVLPLIRSNSTASQELTLILKDFEQSPWAKTPINGFLEIREKEMDTIQRFLEISQKRSQASKGKPVVVDLPGEGAGNVCLLENEIIVELLVKVLPNIGGFYFCAHRPEVFNSPGQI